MLRTKVRHVVSVLLFSCHTGVTIYINEVHTKTVPIVEFTNLYEKATWQQKWTNVADSAGRTNERHVKENCSQTNEKFHGNS